MSILSTAYAVQSPPALFIGLLHAFDFAPGIARTRLKDGVGPLAHLHFSQLDWYAPEIPQTLKEMDENGIVDFDRAKVRNTERGILAHGSHLFLTLGILCLEPL